MKVQTRIITAAGAGIVMAGLAAGPALASTHTVQAGDTLSGIAASAGVPLSKVEAANRWIKNPNLIYVGQFIKVPDGRSGITPMAPTYYQAPAASGTPSAGSDASDGVSHRHPGSTGTRVSQHRHLLGRHGHLVGQHRHLERHVLGEHRHQLAGVVPAVRGLARVRQQPDRVVGRPVRHPAEHLGQPRLLGHRGIGVRRPAERGVPAAVRPGRHLAVGALRRLLIRHRSDHGRSLLHLIPVTPALLTPPR